MSSTVVAVLAIGLIGVSARAALRAGRACDVAGRLVGTNVLPPGPPRSSSWPWRAAAERRRVVRELPEVLEDVARSLRSGTSLRRALAEASGASSVVGGARADVAGVVHRTERGVPLGGALDAWSSERPLPEVRLAVAALTLGLEAGATSPHTVDGVASSLRERRAVAAELTAQATQARLSAIVIALLPLGFTTWACLTDGRVASFLFATPAGWACLIGGLVLQLLGAAWMTRIIRSAR